MKTLIVPGKYSVTADFTLRGMIGNHKISKDADIRIDAANMYRMCKVAYTGGFTLVGELALENLIKDGTLKFTSKLI